MFCRRLLFLSAIISLVECSIFGQSVVSVRAGVVHFFEGSVSIDGQQLEQKFGKFYDIKEGSELRTDQGRAEVLLTPGTFLRVDENSSIRMLSNRLTDTRVEFIGGAAALDSLQATPDTPVTMSYRAYQVHFRKQGRYKFNSAPAELRVIEGEAEVALNGKSTIAGPARAVAFAAPLTARSFDPDTEDGLDRWAKERSDAITAENASAAASDTLTSALDQPPATGTYDYGSYPPFPGDAPLDRSGLWTGFGGPYSMYSGPLGPYGYIPFYGLYGSRYRGFGYRGSGRGLGMTGYRPHSYRTGTYSPPTVFHPAHRMPAAPVFHPAMPGGVMSHPGAAAHSGGRVGGHR